MSGLIALFVLGVWGLIVYFASFYVVKKITVKSIKISAQIAVAVLLFIIPVADDIMGGFQFRSVCSKESVLVVDEEKVKGKTVVSMGAKDSKLVNYILPITKLNFSYKDFHTNEILISWNDFRAEGGWLSHAIGFSEGHPPYTFNGYCYPENSGSKIFKKLNIDVKYN